MIKAVIDIGSNSIKMRIALVDGGRVQVLRDETEVVRLGRGMSENGMLSEESMKAACGAVSRMVRKAGKLGADIFAAGTMALRSAGNSLEFIRMVKESSGIDVHILTGHEEAQYSWAGALDGFDVQGEVIMFDSGGGSTEFVSGSNGEMSRVVSVPVGAVSLSERFFYAHDRPIRRSECEQAIIYIRNLFTEHSIETFSNPDSHVIAVGGGAVTMSSVKYACENFVPSYLHGSTLTLRDTVRQIRMYSSLTLSERENIIGLPSSRADVILGSACIIFTALRVLGAKSCKVSINGLRHGLLLRESGSS